METVVNRGFRGEVPEAIDFYNLDMIIAVGYRVNSRRATDFRIWATKAFLPVAEIRRLERAVTGYLDYIEIWLSVKTPLPWKN